MSRAELSRLARSDLDEIWLFIAQNDITAADRFIDNFSHLFGLLAKNPFLGIARDDLESGLRGFPFENYLVLYFVANFGVEIYRVLHTRRDVSDLFN